MATRALPSALRRALRGERRAGRYLRHRHRDRWKRECSGGSRSSRASSPGWSSRPDVHRAHRSPRCPEDHEEQLSWCSCPTGWTGGRSAKASWGAPCAGEPSQCGTGRWTSAVRRRLPDVSTALSRRGAHGTGGVNGPGGYFVLVGSPAASLAGRGGASTRSRAGGGESARGGCRRAGTQRAAGRPAAAQEPLDAWGRVGKGPCGRGGAWVRDAARVTLPGLRIVGDGRDPGARPDRAAGDR